MTASHYILALDLGTTGNRAFLFDAAGQVVSQAYQELTQIYPQPGWVEHDPIEIWQTTRHAMQAAIATAGIAATQIRAIGLTVQRETCLLWDKTTGMPLHNAIVWQDRRTAAHCQDLRDRGHAAEIFQRTGLVIDAYFSATKLSWLLKNTAHSGVDPQNLLVGTIDTWILWQLTGRQVHATDDSNASRTMLYNLSSRQWDPALLELFEIPAHLLPSVQPSLSWFGVTTADLLGAEIPITAILGDQQAALFAHGCDRPGLVKCTYGTGSFLVAHTGDTIVRSPQSQPLIATIAWSQQAQSDQSESRVGYALEGSMFTTGACIQWLRDGLKLITTAAETEALAQEVRDSGGVYFVPALSGLGAPHWDMTARGAFLGLTGGVQRSHLVRAVLESIAYQVKEVIDAIHASGALRVQRLKVDGGACENNFLMQLQADLLEIPVERPQLRDMTVLGAAFAAGLTSGLWEDYDSLVKTQAIDRIFEPGSAMQQTTANFTTWQKAVGRAKQWISEK